MEGTAVCSAAAPRAARIKRSRLSAAERSSQRAKELGESRRLGLLPEGNQWLGDGRVAAGGGRERGLGALAALNDATVLLALEHFDAATLTKFGRCSRHCLAFAMSDDLWMNLVWNDFEKDPKFEFRGSWRATYAAKAMARRCPSAATTASPAPPEDENLLRGVYSDFLFQRWYCATVALQNSWQTVDTIPRVDAAGLSRERFVDEFENPSRPVILIGAAKHWAAMGKWTREHLTRQYGDASFLSGPVEMKLSDFFSYAAENSDEAPLFVFCPKFADRCPELGTDYEVPLQFSKNHFMLLEKPPLHRWLLLGNKRSGSKWHIDPNRTHAWNGVVSGAKRWMFLPPGCPPPGVHPSEDGARVTQPVSLVEWYLNFYHLAVEKQDNREARRKYPFWDGRMLEGTCGPGDIVFVPSGWWHAVLNLEDDTYAVTQNYVAESNLADVRRFLRETPEQVSGVPEERKETLSSEFEAALAAAGVAAAAEQTTPQPTPATGGSVWDSLRASGRKLVIG